ncbi:alpha-glucuronidase family glycosyl hydrolase [Paenibacillus sp. MMS20-IR301]|uniref:alpha-glucuronidase family glycosyl hydrolase n=1 Tax=Paenibacillus sp. MMS20-IR301 TaxID=2895946 RepID=UPI0028EDBEBE|nr:alpha-glucuronidase family glycosyl hydrolase [Paenibacillus sp. MMS20-IR301]WNS44190.1 alpha-glucuronidase family glycosyl hydrolase [Paenibacillus sp. MMS20-IR301]
MSQPTQKRDSGYEAWLTYPALPQGQLHKEYMEWCGAVSVTEEHETIQAALSEWQRGILLMLGTESVQEPQPEGFCVAFGTFQGGNTLIRNVFAEMSTDAVGAEGFAIRTSFAHKCIAVGAAAPAGLLYGVFHLLRLLGSQKEIGQLDEIVNPVNALRMINHWDNFDGSVERGYSGRSFFYEHNRFVEDMGRITDYARLMSTAGINAIAINNVNVHALETLFISTYLPEVARIAGIFRTYGIRLFLSVNFAGPMHEGEVGNADPLDPGVRQWWQKKAADIYRLIPDFGGFVVKADSENRPGPFTYGRDHADGANMLAEALEPFGGIVIWRCFVYNCKQDWRDRKTDRARAAFDHFKPLDGKFKDNVILQIKNGPMDFQVREPVSPLFGALEQTNQVIEFQIAQEYTGQQRHVCYLVPQWKEIMEFDTQAKGGAAPVKHIVDGSVWGNRYSGVAAVSSVGNDRNWTGHLLAQANLYGFGRLAWNPELSSEEIAAEWIALTFGSDTDVAGVISRILLDSWEIYESYTAPLGVGWMINPEHHYGPNVDGYEYSQWGTYHYADRQGIGVDRTTATGTGYSAQYMGSNARRYDSLAACPDELLLFFHHVPYTHVLHSGKTVIQHIYDSHFAGAERAAGLLEDWRTLKNRVAEGLYVQVEERLQGQAAHAREWRDQINTYFYRKSGIEDAGGRRIY